MIKQPVNFEIKGHVNIIDDLGNVLLDKDNAIHPENMARAVARAFSNENNFYIHRMAFGNGGTNIDAAQQITYNTPNNGVTDGVGWLSELYNETYTENVDESETAGTFGDGPGANPGGDPAFTEHNVNGPGVVSRPVGTLAEVRVQATLNAGEPSGQFATDGDVGTSTETEFQFDEIGLFTTGQPHTATSGYQDVDIGNKVSSDDTGLAASTMYDFQIDVDGVPQSVTITTGVGTVTYSDLIALINAVINPGAEVELGALTPLPAPQFQIHSKFRFNSTSTGATSTIVLTDGGGVNTPLFGSLTDFNIIEPAVDGDDAGVANDAVNNANEGERMLTHVIFNPVLKSANRTLTITYTLTISLS